MSRVGKKPVVVPSGVTPAFKDGNLTVTGPKGTLVLAVHDLVSVKVESDSITVSVAHPENKREKAIWGLFRSLVQNLVDGVTKGYSKELDIVGVGFKAEVKGKSLVMSLGFSHPVEFILPDGIEAKVEKQPQKAGILQYQTTVTLTGADKQKVGQTAANIRDLKKPEPYKGKGIKYGDEVINRKAGKVVKAVGGGK
jgi:large subunit ribosomal protein L6